MNTQNTNEIIQVKVYSGSDGSLYQLSDKEFRVITTLCPHVLDWVDYKSIVTPDVLQSIDLVKGVFFRVNVYENKEFTDPFAVGILPRVVYPTFDLVKKEGKRIVSKLKRYEDVTIQEAKDFVEGSIYTLKDFTYLANSSVENYLIVQWGREIKPLNELSSIAKSVYMRENKLELLKAKLEIEGKLSLLELTADKMFGMEGY